MALLLSIWQLASSSRRLPLFDFSGLFRYCSSGVDIAPSSTYRGLSWRTHLSKWQVRARVNGTQTSLGCFALAEDAAHAYDGFIRASGTSVELLRRLNFPTANELACISSAVPRSTGRGCHNSQVEASSKRLLADRLDRNSWDLVWMPEGTRADGALRPRISGYTWFGIQMKAATQPCRPNAYSFSCVRGYEGLLMVCIALDKQYLWMLPGGAVKSTRLQITLGGKWDQYRCSWSQLSAVLACAWMCRDTFLRRPLSSLRRPSAQSSQVELLSLDLLAQALHDVGLACEAPIVQNGPVDMLVDTNIRSQCKARTARSNATPTFRVGMTRRCGSSGSVPYSVGDFDAFLACLVVGESLTGCFVIPARELVSRGYLDPIKWRTGITLHLPWLTPKLAKARLAKEWQAAYFVNIPGGRDEFRRDRLRHLMLACRDDAAHGIERRTTGLDVQEVSEERLPSAGQLCGDRGGAGGDALGQRLARCPL